jgi:hypothetical protein
MRVLAALLIFLPIASTGVGSEACPTESITVYFNQEVRLRLLSPQDTPARSIMVELYLKAKVLGALLTGRDGEVNFGTLPEGNYKVVVTRWGRLDLHVRPEQGTNGPVFTWFLPHSKITSSSGKKSPTAVCPILMAVEN